MTVVSAGAPRHPERQQRLDPSSLEALQRQVLMHGLGPLAVEMQSNK